jgi:hypothetical protein
MAVQEVLKKIDPKADFDITEVKRRERKRIQLQLLQLVLCNKKQTRR